MILPNDDAVESSSAGIALACGLLAGVVHLVAVGGGWAYNLGLKRTVLSFLPYAGLGRSYRSKRHRFSSVLWATPRILDSCARRDDFGRPGRGEPLSLKQSGLEPDEPRAEPR